MHWQQVLLCFGQWLLTPSTSNSKFSTAVKVCINVHQNTCQLTKEMNVDAWERIYIMLRKMHLYKHIYKSKWALYFCYKHKEKRVKVLAWGIYGKLENCVHQLTWYVHIYILCVYIYIFSLLFFLLFKCRVVIIFCNIQKIPVVQNHKT